MRLTTRIGAVLAGLVAAVLPWVIRAALPQGRHCVRSRRVRDAMVDEHSLCTLDINSARAGGALPRAWAAPVHAR